MCYCLWRKTLGHCAFSQSDHWTCLFSLLSPNTHLVVSSPIVFSIGSPNFFCLVASIEARRKARGRRLANVQSSADQYRLQMLGRQRPTFPFSPFSLFTSFSIPCLFTFLFFHLFLLLHILFLPLPFSPKCHYRVWVQPSSQTCSHIWSGHDTDLGCFDSKIKSVYLHLQMHQNWWNFVTDS